MPRPYQHRAPIRAGLPERLVALPDGPQAGEDAEEASARRSMLFTNTFGAEFAKGFAEDVDVEPEPAGERFRHRRL